VSAELQFFLAAKSAGIFRHLDADRVAQINQEVGGNDIALVMCGDCRHSRDKLSHLFKTFPGQQVHVMAFNGGGIIADALAPCNKRGFNFAQFAQEQILQSLNVKGHIAQLFLEAHFPCAVAGQSDMTIMDQVRSLISVKCHLKELIGDRKPVVKIGLLYHWFNDNASIEGARRMYYFCDREMEEFLSQYRDLLVAV